MRKELLYKKISQVSRLNKPYESPIRQRPSTTFYNLFINNCKDELIEQGETLCYPIHLEELLETFGDLVDVYYNEEFNEYKLIVNKFVVVKLPSGIIKKYPITSKISTIRGEVLRYE
jgi:hypothetical protein